MRIYCNGAQTENNYFKALLEELRLTAHIRIIPQSHNRLSLVRKVEKCLKEDNYKVDNAHKVWVVFDVDACPKGDDNLGAIKSQTDNAVLKCIHHGYKPIVSNDSFEFWFCLHYNPNDFVHRHRDDLASILSKAIGKKYEKNTEMYLRIRPMQDVAIASAKRLCDTHPRTRAVSQCQPYTNVHELIETLREISDHKKKALRCS
jgi:hypothetical protein